MANQAPVDVYTFVHLAAGILGQRVGLTLSEVVGAAIGWELMEGPLKTAAPNLFPDPSSDSLENSTVDVLAAAVGFYLSQMATGEGRPL